MPDFRGCQRVASCSSRVMLFTGEASPVVMRGYHIISADLLQEGVRLVFE